MHEADYWYPKKQQEQKNKVINSTKVMVESEQNT